MLPPWIIDRIERERRRRETPREERPRLEIERRLPQTEQRPQPAPGVTVVTIDLRAPAVFRE